MNFYSLTLKGAVGDIDVVNTFWYLHDEEPDPTEARLAQITDAFVLELKPAIRAILCNTYTFLDLTVQGYNETWTRTPYLPAIYPQTETGAVVATAFPPIVALIASARVTPVTMGRRRKADGSIVQTPVRRGYWAFAPIAEGDVPATGAFDAYNQTSGGYYNLRVALADTLDPVGWTSPARPIRVSKPLPDETARGYGLVSSVQWRREVSTRRSRKLGRGS